MDIDYSRHYIIVFPGIIFPMGRNNMKNFEGESAEARLLRAKDTEEDIPKNTLFSPMTEQLLLNAENHITKKEDFAKN